jgi:hypothetical protein
MLNTSFTFEVWLYANSFYNNNPYTDNDIIGQCEQSILDQCLHLVIRNQQAYFGFFANDVRGNQVSKHERQVKRKIVLIDDILCTVVIA